MMRGPININTRVIYLRIVSYVLNKDRLLTYNVYHVSEHGWCHRICPAHAGFLWNNAAVLGDTIKGTFRKRKLKSLVLFSEIFDEIFSFFKDLSL